MDTEATAKALLARGQLKTRVTIIPLSKVCRPACLQHTCGLSRAAVVAAISKLQQGRLLPDLQLSA